MSHYTLNIKYLDRYSKIRDGVIYRYSLDFIDGKTEYKWSQSSHSLYALDHRVTFFLGEKIVRLFCSKKNCRLKIAALFLFHCST